MSLERNGKSEAEAPGRRPAGNLKSFGLGIVFGWLAAPMLLLAVTSLLPPTYTYEVIFVKLDLPDAGVSKMELDGRYMEHLFVSPHIVLTRGKTSSAPKAVLTFDFHRERETAPEKISIELAIAELWRRGCTTEIVLSSAGAASRGCLNPIKPLF